MEINFSLFTISDLVQPQVHYWLQWFFSMWLLSDKKVFMIILHRIYAFFFLIFKRKVWLKPSSVLWYQCYRTTLQLMFWKNTFFRSRITQNKYFINNRYHCLIKQFVFEIYGIIYLLTAPGMACNRHHIYSNFHKSESVFDGTHVMWYHINGFKCIPLKHTKERESEVEFVVRNSFITWK